MTNFAPAAPVAFTRLPATVTVEQWDFHEFAFDGPATGNPFVDVTFTAQFINGDRCLRVTGFYDGDGVYRLRFMPPTVGEWSFVTQSNAPELNGRTGRLLATPARSPKNHGIVQVANQFHFAYADGTPHKSFGTTAYSFAHQGETLENQTLETLAKSPFNKVRMCVFPKRYAYTASEPEFYPFEGTAPNDWDFTRFNPAFFAHLESILLKMRDLDIQADLILLHPYDRGHWGFDRMPADADDRYLRYVVARFAAFRNVWWSLANEHDFMKEKQPDDWHRFGPIVAEADPYGHLLSVHNGFVIFDHWKPWVTHISMQNGSAVADFGRAGIYRDVWRKPVVFDECKYEGNIEQRWGNLSAEEMVHRFWQGVIAGTYVGHGETYKHPDDVIWSAHGGKLHGQSPARIAFCRKILEDGPRLGVDPIDKWQDLQTAGQPGEYYLVYFGKEAPTSWRFELPRQGLADGMKFRLDVIDTWNMTVTPVKGEFTVTGDTTYRYHAEGDPTLDLPGRPWMALRLTRTNANETIAVKDKIIYGES
ncbi:MAG: DUF5605 domain-containing protein [Tepidisphaeraceae bacterium]